MTHGAAKVDFHTRMDEKPVAVGGSDNHHVDAEGTAIGGGESTERPGTDDGTYIGEKVGGNITAELLAFPALGGKDVARVGSVGGGEKGKTRVGGSPVAMALKLHAEVDDTAVARLNHDGVLLFQNVDYPTHRVIVDGSCDKTHSASAAAPWCLEHGIASRVPKGFDDFIAACAAYGAANGTGKLKKGKKGGGGTAVGQAGYVGETLVGRKHFRVDDRRGEGGTHAVVPSPRADAVGGDSTQVGIFNEADVARLHTGNSACRLPYPVVSPFGVSLVLNEHHVAIVSPKGRNEAEVVAQLSSGMRRCDPFHAVGKRNVVLWIENVNCHRRLSVVK